MDVCSKLDNVLINKIYSSWGVYVLVLVKSSQRSSI